ncbi:MAG TPA: hypothetical protein VFJ97_02860 [Dermatophilaceae bacterium]|nr:hypothetical protein [Dermatophilaceae bacterium]
MTTEQRLQWVCVPAGVLGDGRLRVCVVMAPRLRSDEGRTLALYPDLLDWPATVSAATFTLTAEGVGVPCEVIGDPPETALWTALFPAATPVNPYAFADYADRPLVSFAVMEVLAQLRRLYARTAAASPDRLPPTRTARDVEPRRPGLDELLSEVVRPGQSVYGEQVRALGTAGAAEHFLAGARAEAVRRRRTGDRGGDPVEPLTAGAVFEVERAALFHSSPDTEPREMPGDGEHYLRTVDFHQMLSALGDHPGLLRRLGLVIDLAVADLPAATGFIAAAPVFAPVDDTVRREHLAHQTAYLVQGGRFVTARQSPEPEVPEGLLPLPAAAFGVSQVDVDGAALKSLAVAATMTQPSPAAGGPGLHQPDTAGLPALRTTGLSLVNTGRAAALQGEFTRNLAVNTAIDAGPTRLYAEDLVRGYRLDVFDDTTGGWRSLHEQTVTATAQRYAGQAAELPGEGQLQVSLTGRLTPPGQQPDPDGELYAHEALVTWDGWSLSAPRAGAALSRHPDAPDPARPETQPAKVANDPHTAMGLSLSSTAVPGSLPRLRFGRSYRLRLREVDLAGRGLTVAEATGLLDAGAAGDLAADAYLRFEPVPAPAAVPYTAYGEGASLHRLVVRSDVGLDPAGYAEAFNAEHAGTHPGYAAVDVRHIAPPKASYELVEKHGLFDLAIGSDGTPPTPERVADIAAAYAVARRESGSFDDPDAPGAEVVTIPAAGGGGERYLIHRVDQLELPYLPDPLAVGAVFFGLPGQPAGEPFVVPFDGPTWHQARPLRLQLADGTGPPTWDEGSRLLTVRLPQATTARVLMASQLDRLDLMGMLRWCEQELAGGELDRVVEAMKANRCWLTTPWHELELVHAVQHPLVVPDVTDLRVNRSVGQTFADLRAEVLVDPPSTERVDVGATWTDPVDDVRDEAPRELACTTTVLRLPLATVAAVRDDGQPAGYLLRDRRLLTFDSGVARELGWQQPPAHQFGDTKYRRVSYTVTATTPFREDFPVSWIDQPDRLSVASAPIAVDVPSSAPPKLPDVHYLMPTMGWSQAQEGDTAVSRRRGGGVRVWMGRGWWSSGAGELLGVVVGSDVISPKGADYPFVSLVGQDPTRASAPLRNLRAASFRGDPVVATGVELVGAPVGPVTVVAFEPRYDASTRRWFCDVDIDTGTAYQPFLRLSLVRYQPVSLSHCAVSGVVLADIVQPVPDRTATVTTGADDPLTRTVTVAGPSYTAVRGRGELRADDAALPAVTVQVQRADPAVSDEALRWQTLPETVVTLTRTVAGAVATWTGQVRLPADGEAVEQLRLLVVEEERLLADGATPGAERVVPRVVYAAAFPLR